MKWRFRSVVPVANLARFEIRQGDRLIVTVPASVNQEDALFIGREVRKATGHDPLIVPDSVNVSVVRDNNQIGRAHV